MDERPESFNVPVDAAARGSVGNLLLGQRRGIPDLLETQADHPAARKSLTSRLPCPARITQIRAIGALYGLRDTHLGGGFRHTPRCRRLPAAAGVGRAARINCLLVSQVVMYNVDRAWPKLGSQSRKRSYRLAAGIKGG